MTTSPVSNKQSNLIVFAPPYTGPGIMTPLQSDAHYAGVALSSAQLFVASNVVIPRIDVYSLPIAANGTTAFSISSGLTFPTSLALDNNGNLYVGNTVNITVYSAPLSASSTPSVILPLPGGFLRFPRER